ncbi:methyltransferase domain-containing protein [Cylindrospermopsis raciborskii]|uniref:methyltransferase domain-containing protein n=1 Tax=Cylindrospermopsis raciborskii TaxID=77022 RepID=UPI0035C8EF53
MSNLALIAEIKKMYLQGRNVMEFLRDQNHGGNTTESIMISYDLQSGSYTKLAEKNPEYVDQYTDALQSVFSKLSTFESIMEVGIGEATTMNPLMIKLDVYNKIQKFGFDISWSRVRYALQNCQQSRSAINLFVADLFEIPLPDNSVDIVYTSHSLEPNGGKEKQALKELYRVAKKFIVLLEPDFQRANTEGKERMRRHGYVRDLATHAQELGFDVIEDRPFDVFINPLNPTGLTVIKKGVLEKLSTPNFVCPITKTSLMKVENVFFSETSGLIYPIIDQIPCLLSSSATLGTHFSCFNS